MQPRTLILRQNAALVAKTRQKGSQRWQDQFKKKPRTEILGKGQRMMAGPFQPRLPKRLQEKLEVYQGHEDMLERHSRSSGGPSGGYMTSTDSITRYLPQGSG